MSIMERYLLILFISTLFSGYVCESEVNEISAACPLTGQVYCCLNCKELKKEMNNSDSERDPLKGTFNYVAGVLFVIVSVSVTTVIIIVRIRRLRRRVDEKEQIHFDRSPGSKRIETNRKDVEESGDRNHISENRDTGTNETSRILKDSLQPPDEQSKACSIGNMREGSISTVLDDVQERIMCKICLSRKMCVVFMPCNHMVACASCSDVFDRCAVCRTVIKGTFVVYTQF